MEDRLKKILDGLDEIGNQMQREEEVWRQELEERQRLHLHGADAIKHYNEWMVRHNMKHLIVEETGA
jgi:hypothetical protein